MFDHLELGAASVAAKYTLHLSRRELPAQQALEPMQSGFAAEQGRNKCALIESAANSRNVEALKHLLKLNVLLMKLVSELGPQHFDFLVEDCQFIEKHVP
jgi:hypothetical protein